MSLSYRPVLANAPRPYRRADLQADIGAGITVGVIALPLAIGFAIASGVSPAQGIWTAIIGGLIISIFGGSIYQIGGPTGAFVPVLAAVTAAHGYQGLALATLMAGALLILAGLFKLGALLRYIPYPVIAGFTSGIAVIIFLGQMPDFLGESFQRPGEAPELAHEIIHHLPQVTNFQPLLIGGIGLLIVFLLPRFTKKIPAAIVAVVTCSALAALFRMDVATIGSKFGAIPQGFPAWQPPAFSLNALRELAGPAFIIAALGAIESLLSATVADGMTDTRHDSNSELIGQGLANLAVPFFGGFAATGAIARTAANVRAGARSPVAGITHAVVLLVFALAAAPLAAYIPLAALAAVLMGVAIRMAEWESFAELWRSSKSEFWILITTFSLTILFDLTIGVATGLGIAVVLFMKRMEDVSHVKILTADNDTEQDGALSLRGKSVPEGVVLYRFEGPLFFAAVEKLEAALRHHSTAPKCVIFRMRHVPSLDSSALRALEVIVEKMRHSGIPVLMTAVQPHPMKLFFKSGFAERLGLENFCGSVDQALAKAAALLKEQSDPETAPDA